MTVMGSQYDGTPFEMPAGKLDVIVNDEFTEDRDIVDGFVIVEKVASQNNRTHIILPKPTIQFGHQITVSDYALMPIGVTLQDFNPQTR